MKQSFAWWCFARNDLAPEKLLRTAAEIGYTGVDLIDQRYWSLAREHGLQIVSVGGHTSIEHGLNRRDQHSRIEQEILANLELAKEWGISNLICFSGSRAGLSDEEGAENTAEGLRRVVQAAEAAKVTLIVELLNSKVDHPDYQCDKTAWGVRVCELVNSPYVRLLYDIYHMQIMEGDLIRTIRQYHPYFAHYHTAGNPGRHDIDETQEIYYPPIYRAIQATGYSGYIAHEFIPKGDPLQALKVAFEDCEQSKLEA
ncbi:hydroxypyruvate isomerase family protein [Dictyobacter kobayashii]|uniref:Hydroxypyruvate isomerase n=1 Tax=Dictyobacter kobayashii TaxID=2014872 RepID=A0A402AGF8_9CHLR|nr:TIM barrel protein [Dictyobacter kobayashii]GCE18165.1 hydroxypyruvate isomerase [Dictyobacter kobayashii]